MRIVRELADRLTTPMGFRVRRAGETARFQALDECLINMKRRGYEPRIIIDGGANMGQFHSLARTVYPDAHYHLIEPQPVCASALREIARRAPGNIELHEVALSEPGVCSVRMVGRGTTGAYVAKEGETPSDALEVPATTLDELLDGGLRREDRTLLKLDLESHELPALRGAARLLQKIETVLIEVSFYDIADWGRPTVGDVVAFFRDAEFDLYEIASLASRPRDRRLRLGDVVFVRRGTPLLRDTSWE